MVIRSVPNACNLFTAGAALLLAGCATVPTGPGPTAGWPGTFDRVVLSPGRSVVCYSDPCTVWFQLPPGSGSRAVRVNNMPAGEGDEQSPFHVGSYYRFQSPAIFTVDGLDVPPAVLWVNSRF